MVVRRAGLDDLVEVAHGYFAVIAARALILAAVIHQVEVLIDRLVQVGAQEALLWIPHEHGACPFRRGHDLSRLLAIIIEQVSQPVSFRVVQEWPTIGELPVLVVFEA